ncbi:high mobility group box domain-containing protein, partial [Radiomyces spectabilis]|uniref:high mobility group box domain-containing protein n=1 Tax=Radiomyces spectabilis TaxID=64574 RepID=UPI00221F525C
KKRKKKDPNAPKRYMGSYLLWSQEFRHKLKELEPDLNPRDVAKAMGEKWKSMTEKEKEPYVKRAEKEKARYEQEMSEY